VTNFDHSITALRPGDPNFLKLLFFKKFFLPETTTIGAQTTSNNKSMAYAIEAILAHRLLETARIVYDPQPSDAEVVKSSRDPEKLMESQYAGYVPNVHDANEAFRNGVSHETLDLCINLLLSISP
jgi:hypothetical protein